MKPPLGQVMREYHLSVLRAAFYICRDPDDAEDIAQETFLAYYNTDVSFESDEHVRAWLLRVAVNKSRNLLRSFWRRNRRSLEEVTGTFEFQEPEDSELMRAVLELPEKCRAVIHLFYYEDYPVKDIAEIMGMRENTVKSHLHRGRALLKKKLKEGWTDD